MRFSELVLGVSVMGHNFVILKCVLAWMLPVTHTIGALYLEHSMKTQSLEFILKAEEVFRHELEDKAKKIQRQFGYNIWALRGLEHALTVKALELSRQGSAESQQ